ncbi:hypothetical protein SUGI_0532610 [Cryptomeria japonica]|nr:hypothetical protein SUGI_0532610 [Cryptomeria japonica]
MVSSADGDDAGDEDGDGGAFFFCPVLPRALALVRLASWSTMMLVAEEGSIVKGVVLGCNRDIWDPGGFSLDSNVSVIVLFPTDVEMVVVILVWRSWREALELMALVWLGFECGLFVLFAPFLLIKVVMLGESVLSNPGASSSILEDHSLEAGDFLVGGSLLSSSFLSSPIEVESAAVLACLDDIFIRPLFQLKVVEEGLANSQAIADFIDPQNAARKAVGLPALKWNSTVAAFARNYARQRRNDCLLQHSEGSPYGENIFWGEGPKWTRRQAMNAWIDERKWYAHANNTCTGPDCTHYTQMVWATTTSVGCSIIKCKSNDTWVICSYDPPGNYIGARPY